MERHMITRMSSRAGGHEVLVDSFGRERAFHGTNVIVKGPPWISCWAHPIVIVHSHIRNQTWSFGCRRVQLKKPHDMARDGSTFGIGPCTAIHSLSRFGFVQGCPRVTALMPSHR
eukprot:6482878-Amphidinium_carterae.1